MADLRSPEGDESQADPALDRIARVAARALHVPFALITLLDGEPECRVWSVGCDVDEAKLADDLSFTGKLLLPATGSRSPIPLTLTISGRQPGSSPHHLSRPLRIGGEDPV